MTHTTESTAEIAPSELRADEPTFARLVAVLGLSAFLLGLIAIVANQFSPRWVGTSGGYLFVAVGLAALLFHALRDGDVEFRRAYGGLGLFLLVAALIAAFVPGPVFSDAIAKTAGYHLLPWTPTFALLGLAFLIAPLGRETDAFFRNLAHLVLLTVGCLLCVASVVVGLYDPDFLVGPGILLAIVGLAYLAAFFSHMGTSGGIGYFVAVALGLFGAAALAWALGRSIWPTVLSDGPGGLKNAYQRLDFGKAAGRAAAILVCLALVAWGVRGRRMSMVVRATLVAVGLGFAGVFLYASFVHTEMSPVKPYLVPSGLLMMLVGIAYLGVSLGTVSDQPFITLVRRELASYFFSSIAYFVMFGIAFISWFGYWLFLGTLHEQSRAGEAVQEPILQGYIPGSLFGPLCVIMLVPAITMRLFSEEKRSGTLEVLLTAPLSEASITFSKILAAWLFYMVCWIPMGLYLIAIRVEGDQPFDYRPMLSLYIAIGASGFAFIAMGAFFSSLTNNQIVAAVMTFVGMLLLFVLRWHTFLPIPLESVRSALAAVASASYWPLWAESLRGQLLVRDLALQLSMGVFWTYLTLKSLEARKWG